MSVVVLVVLVGAVPAVAGALIKLHTAGLL
jgi:hypothetical protein